MRQNIINSEHTLTVALGDLREAFQRDKYVTMTLKSGKKRSLDQNAISHCWYEQVVNELREDTALGVKAYCKLHFGVPILRAEDDGFREAYDSHVKSLPYETKLFVMGFGDFPVTSRMTKPQLSQYCEAMQSHYAGRGVMLRFPE